MATLVELQEITAEIQGAQLSTYSDMADALNYIATLPGTQYSGQVNMVNVNGTITWQLNINNQTTGSSAAALIGDIIVIKNNAIVSVVKQGNFASLYQVKPS